MRVGGLSEEAEKLLDHSFGESDRAIIRPFIEVSEAFFLEKSRFSEKIHTRKCPLWISIKKASYRQIDPVLELLSVLDKFSDILTILAIDRGELREDIVTDFIAEIFCISIARVFTV